MPGSGKNGNVRLILGIVGLALFGIPTVVLLAITIIINIVRGAFIGATFILSIIFAAVTIAALIGLISGLRRKNLIARLSRYNVLFEPKTVLAISEVSTETGISQKQIVKDMHAAHVKRLHFNLKCDFDENTLIRGDSTWKQYVAAKEQRRKKEAEDLENSKKMADPNLPPIEAFRIEGTDMLQRIRVANVALPGADISLKLDKLERTTSQIVRHVEQYPEKLPETRKLMSYHLPATLKIVEKYREYENLEFKTGSVIEAQKQIEEMLDTVNVAFKKYLDKLMEFDTLDVTTDIEVLRQLFERDGLTDMKFEEAILVNK